MGNLAEHPSPERFDLRAKQNGAFGKGVSSSHPDPESFSERQQRSHGPVEASDFSALDFFYSALIGCAALIYTLPGIFIREFYRHTEADRTLIGWEMLERGNFLLPHLLGDYYLTKPPVFYALLAGAIKFFGPEVWAARLITVGAISLLLPLLYLFYRLAGLKRESSLLAVAITALCGQVFEYSVIAEIDLTYVLFSSVALGSLYLSAVIPRARSLLLVSGAALILAFFTKGPPVLVFYVAGIAGLVSADRFGVFYSDGATKRLLPPGWITAALAVVVVLVGVIVAWLGLLVSSVGWKEVASIFNNEVLVRFVKDTKADERGRGTFFYIGSLIAGLAPWTLLLAGLLRPGRGQVRAAFERNRALYVFCLAVIVPSLLVFSIASGKSNRYLLPLYPFFAPLLVLCAAGIPALVQASVGRRIYSWLGPAAAATALGFAICFDFISVPERVVAVLIAFSAVGAGNYLTRRYRDWSGVAAAFALCFILARYPFSVFFDRARNRVYSIRPVSASIEGKVPDGEPVYVLELFERWLPYYLQRDGVTTLRLTPTIAGRLSQGTGDVYVLLNSDYEGWRLEQLERNGGSYSIVQHYKTAKYQFLLVKIAARDAALFRPKKAFATAPSGPY